MTQVLVVKMVARQMVHFARKVAPFCTMGVLAVMVLEGERNGSIFMAGIIPYITLPIKKLTR